jgi:hypothetical protein
MPICSEHHPGKLSQFPAVQDLFHHVSCIFPDLLQTSTQWPDGLRDLLENIRRAIFRTLRQELEPLGVGVASVVDTTAVASSILAPVAPKPISCGKRYISRLSEHIVECLR